PDGPVFLRVWLDQIVTRNGLQFVRVTNAKRAEQHKEENQRYKSGYLERLEHVELIQIGVPCYLVVCIVADKDAMPRRIADIVDDSVFLGGDLVQLDGDWWIELKRKIRLKNGQLPEEA